MGKGKCREEAELSGARQQTKPGGGRGGSSAMPTTLVLDDGGVDAFEEEGDDGIIKKISVPVGMWAR
jgi:hypothetical protein